MMSTDQVIKELKSAYEKLAEVETITEERVHAFTVAIATLEAAEKKRINE